MRAPSRKTLAARTQQIQAGTLQVAVQFGSFIQMPAYARIWWLLTGRFDEQRALKAAEAELRQQTLAKADATLRASAPAIGSAR